MNKVAMSPVNQAAMLLKSSNGNMGKLRSSAENAGMSILSVKLNGKVLGENNTSLKCIFDEDKGGIFAVVKKGNILGARVFKSPEPDGKSKIFDALDFVRHMIDMLHYKGKVSKQELDNFVAQNSYVLK